MSIGWLVNDCLTCIPGTKTFWHDLLEWLPGLEDKTSGYTSYAILPDKVERSFWQVPLDQRPNYVIRNATFLDQCIYLVIKFPCYKIIMRVMPGS